jgi:hypothetical protein
MKKIAPRISDQTAELLPELFGRLNTGAEFILDSWPGLYKRTLHGLKGKFTRGELLLMVDVMNGTILTPGISGQHLAINVADGISLDKLNEKWEINGPELNAKIAGLSAFETACLELWIQAFWNREDHGDLDKYVAALEEGKHSQT